MTERMLKGGTEQRVIDHEHGEVLKFTVPLPPPWPNVNWLGARVSEEHAPVAVKFSTLRLVSVKLPKLVVTANGKLTLSELKANGPIAD